MTARALLTKEQIEQFRESLHEHEETVPLCSFEIDDLCDMALAHLAAPEVEPVGMPEEPEEVDDFRKWGTTHEGPIVIGYIDALRAWAYASARTVSEWRGIESAPRNHLPILVYTGYGMRVAFRDVTWTWWPCPAIAALEHAPTHWQPLPSPPLLRESGKEGE